MPFEGCCTGAEELAAGALFVGVAAGAGFGAEAPFLLLPPRPRRRRGRRIWPADWLA